MTHDIEHIHGIDDSYVNIISNAFNIMHIFNMHDFVNDIDSLEDILISLNKTHYTPEDKFLIIMQEPLYYLPDCPYSIPMFNLINIFKKLDIPLHTMIFISNQELLSELHILLKNTDKSNFPIVFAPIVSLQPIISHASSITEDMPIYSSKITHFATTMMRKERVHRNALYNFITKTNIKDKIIMSFNAFKLK